MRKLIFSLLLPFLLSACVSPMRLGISEAEWRNYNPEERKKITDGYYEILKGKFQQSEKVISDGTILRVKISGGQVNMPPFASQYNYSPIEFELIDGECQTILLREINGDKTVDLKACYRNKTLYLDPSRYDLAKKIGSIQLYYSPIWDRGFMYQNVSSSGYAHLINANISVKILNTNES